MRRKKQKPVEIYPDEIFLDSKNIPEFDTQQFEGRLEKPITKRTFYFLSLCLGAIAVFFLAKIFSLQILQGKIFAERSEKNSLKQEILFPPRAVIIDRKGIKLAWDEKDTRNYTDEPGFANILGYMSLPSPQDIEKNKDILMTAKIGKEGIEAQYEDFLKGILGIKLVEKDSQNNTVSESVQELPVCNDNLSLAIDSKIQTQFFQIIDSVARERGFQGGGGIILDVKTGEILSLASWPEYNIKNLQASLGDKNNPFLNRVIAGLYAPGSIIKPLIALAALNEKIITPEKQIFSAGYISIPNPFFSDKQSIFKDWKAHGWVDMRKAIAVSSDVYFYEIGGGFENQKGLGIKKIEEYAKMFGFDSATGIDLVGEATGTIPNPDLKAKSDPHDPIWRIGDTYNASIGQGYFHVTPIEMAVYVSAIANKGKIVQPHLIRDDSQNNSRVVHEINIPQNDFDVVQDGMRMSAEEGTASALNVSSVNIAAKTGTAEVGSAKKYVNSWVIGFFPYENPKYAFAVVMEKGPYSNLVGAPAVMRQLIDWMSIYTPEYLK